MADPVAPAPSAAADAGGLTMAATMPATAHAPAATSQFHTVLSELNPLQYVPVVGTVYRSVTGDTIPESARIFGSLVFSGLTGGPLGAGMNVALLMLEKATGINPEAIGQNLLADIGIGHPYSEPPAGPQGPPLAFAPAAGAAAVAAASGTSVTAAATPQPAIPQPGTPQPAGPTPAVAAAAASGAAPAPTAGAHTAAWSPSQLTAYGVTTTATGDLKRGAVSGADVLNDLELARHQAQTATAGS